jgi:hypothetical protein
MQRPVRTRSVRLPRAERQAALPGSWRDPLAVLLALVTVGCLSLAFLLARDTRFLMPGPLASAHGTIENCSTCHTKSGSGNLGWIHSLVAGDPVADSNACLSCHKMTETAFNAHGASAELLNRSTKRLTKIAATIPAPQSARTQSVAFPTSSVVARGLYCATCHQEHKGANFSLNRISNEQCHSCHVVKFDSFDGHHPEFENYPFKQRTPIIYDHTGHGGKHFPEVAKKYPARRIPGTCASCHNSQADRRFMAVAPFEQTCSSCHLGQITGKERVSGPKGIAFLTLPGLDLQTLKKKNAQIGEWPAASEAELTPFMKVMISRNERGRSLIETVEGLNLQDLTDASDGQIEAVTNLVWEIKRLFYALIWGKASDVLGDLNIGCGAKLSASLVADLTASIPRDVVISAHQQWLPNLGTEMANRPATNDQEQACWITTIGGWSTTIAESGLAVDSETASVATPDKLARANPQTEANSAPGSIARSLRIDPYGRLVKRLHDEAEAGKPDAGRAEAGKAEAGKVEAGKVEAAKVEAARAEAPQPKGAGGTTETANTKSGKQAVSNGEQPQPKAADQTDDLLNPTDEELRGTKQGAAVKGYLAYAGPDSGKETLSAAERPRAVEGGIKGAERIAQAGGAAPQIPAPNAKPPSADAPSKGADQTDDLLNPTEEELRGVAPSIKDAAKAAQPEGTPRKPATASVKPESGTAADAPPRAVEKAPQPEGAPARTPDRPVAADAASRPDANAPAEVASDAVPAAQAKAAPVISIESDVDPESWAEYGGWYRQDYAIFYRPTGHKDKFIYSWLFLTGPQAPKGDRSPAAAVFDILTSKDAQGSCSKCHSVDDIRGKGRLVNFSPPRIEAKRGRFTNFIHEPHFGVLDNRGCLTCHNLEKGRPYLQGYEQGNPKSFASNFRSVKKELCQSCHTSSMARQDCLLCHKYHVNGVSTPTMDTRIPSE